MEHAPRLDRSALVVDDDVFMVSALAEILEDDGFDVHTATNGFSAMRRVLEHRPAVVLLDLALPERSGKELLEDLRADPVMHDVAIVVVTGYAEHLTDWHRAEADGIVAKPFEINDLLATVQRALQKAASRRAEVAPVVAGTHREPGVRTRRASAVRRSRGRR